MIFGRHTALEVVGYDLVSIAQGHVSLTGHLHDAYAPVKIGRVPIVQVIRALAGQRH